VRRRTLHLSDGAVLLLLTPLRSAKSHARVLEAVERQAKFFTSCQIHLMQHVLAKLSFGEPPEPVPCPLAVSWASKTPHRTIQPVVSIVGGPPQ